MDSSITFSNGEKLTLGRLLEDPKLRLPSISLWYQGSCESAVALSDSADELMGFVRALTHVGARSVMATLWPVNDDAARQFAGRFYDYLLKKEKKSKAHAHREAILYVRRAFMKDAYYCAPFVLFGDAWSD